MTTPEPRLFGVRPLVAVALENVVEGFVRQTYGAVASRFRARSAGNLKIRRVMEEIAADEREHAQLAMETARWLQGKMDRIEIVWLENAMRHAVSTLGRQLDAEAHIDLSWEVGVPSRRDALAIWTGLSRRVWNVTSESMWSAAA